MEDISTEIQEVNSCEYDTIVISGGSSKGIVSLGSLQYAYDNFLLRNVKNYIGTSSGAIICYLLAIGYSPIEIMVYICTHQLMEKMQHFNILGMVNGVGASSFASIQELLEKMTISKIGKLITLKDLQDKFGKTLICITHNLTLDETEYLTPDKHPEIPCITALKMSANLPLVFENFRYNDNFYIDGGVSDNFAIDIADSIGKKIIGILIEAEKENFNKDTEMDILEYIYKLMNIPVSQATEYKIKQASKKCTIVRLNYAKIKIFNFNIDAKTKLEMFSSGYQQIKSILS